MSYKIQFMGGINSKPLDNHILVNILDRIFTHTWRINHLETNSSQQKSPTLDLTFKYFSALGYNSALTQASKLDDRRKWGQDDSKRNCLKCNKNKISSSTKKKRFYQNYKDAGRPERLYPNFNTNECKKKKNNKIGKPTVAVETKRSTRSTFFFCL